MSEYPNTGNQPAKPRRTAILAVRQSVEIAKPYQYARRCVEIKKTGAFHGPMIFRLRTK